MSGALLSTTSGGNSSDVVPDAVNWTDISGSVAGNGIPRQGNSQTITGINTPITLRATITGFSSGGTGIRQLQVDVNGSVSTVAAAANATLDFNVSNGQAVIFGGTQNTTTSSSWGGLITVTNQSNGGVTLDSFNLSVTNP